MPRVIVRLPDGRFSIWSTKKSNFVRPSMHKRDLMRFLLDAVKKQYHEKFVAMVADAEKQKGRWQKCLDSMEAKFGKDARLNAEKTNLEYRKWDGGCPPAPKRGAKAASGKKTA